MKVPLICLAGIFSPGGEESEVETVVAMTKRRMLGGVVLMAAMLAYGTPASARTCEQLRTLCYGMRDDKSDCTKPYQRCLKTGVFVTPLGRVFKATR